MSSNILQLTGSVQWWHDYPRMGSGKSTFLGDNNYIFSILLLGVPYYITAMILLCLGILMIAARFTYCRPYSGYVHVPDKSVHRPFTEENESEQGSSATTSVRSHRVSRELSMLRALADGEVKEKKSVWEATRPLLVTLMSMLCFGLQAVAIVATNRLYEMTNFLLDVTSNLADNFDAVLTMLSDIIFEVLGNTPGFPAIQEYFAQFSAFATQLASDFRGVIDDLMTIVNFIDTAATIGVVVIVAVLLIASLVPIFIFLQTRTVGRREKMRMGLLVCISLPIVMSMVCVGFVVTTSVGAADACVLLDEALLNLQDGLEARVNTTVINDQGWVCPSVQDDGQISEGVAMFFEKFNQTTLECDSETGNETNPVTSRAQGLLPSVFAGEVSRLPLLPSNSARRRETTHTSLPSPSMWLHRQETGSGGSNQSILPDPDAIGAINATELVQELAEYFNIEDCQVVVGFMSLFVLVMVPIVVSCGTLRSYISAMYDVTCGSQGIVNSLTIIFASVLLMVVFQFFALFIALYWDSGLGTLTLVATITTSETEKLISATATRGGSIGRIGLSAVGKVTKKGFGAAEGAKDKVVLMLEDETEEDPA
eukprot:CAMPEP_0174895286 /NCGR_PEP_ID=MMETSP0167-20121228/9724_1 /TAXON_ID=38298 /ORGANISM="Rhodella maculata, Strain CCMP736" /LENGTH=596 /DNA_ID=CAMNT_0016134579 /DNA_START=20 /DNA_END=1810 /DNA_ORIENTATION=+